MDVVVAPKRLELMVSSMELKDEFLECSFSISVMRVSSLVGGTRGQFDRDDVDEVCIADRGDGML